MALLAGGDNVAAPFVERWGPIHPEQLLASKPEVILMAGYESVSSAEAMQVGQDVSAETVRQRLQGFAARPGWSELPAVQQGRLYAVYHGATRSIMDAALIEFMAKALYRICSRISIPWPPIRASTSAICPSVPRAPLCWASSRVTQTESGRSGFARLGRALFTPLHPCGRLSWRPFQDCHHE